MQYKVPDFKNQVLNNQEILINNEVKIQDILMFEVIYF